MKKVTKRLFSLDEHLEFNIINNFTITRYFNKAKYPNLTEPFDLYIDYTLIPSPNKVNIVLTYLNQKKKSEGLEEFTLELKNKNAVGKKQIPVKIFTEFEDYNLWKITFTVDGKDKTILNLSA